MTDQDKTFQSDWISPPGDTIKDLIEERDWCQVELAKRLGYSTKHLNQLIKGKASVTEDTALRLERVLGSTAKFWLNREANYRERWARLEAQRCYESWIGWLDWLPLPWLKKVGIIPNRRITEAMKPELVETLLRFFSVASPAEWESRYKNLQGSFRYACKVDSDIGAVTAWLRIGEIQAEKMTVPAYSKKKFREALLNARELTALPPNELAPELHRSFSESGVKLIFVPSVPKADLSGIARWLNPHSPLIQLSLHGKSNDRFWFSLFHESAHILLHSENKLNIFLDSFGVNSSDSKMEKEADLEAANMLIPQSRLGDLLNLQSAQEIKHFAHEINIHPGIVVGRLQHEKRLEYATPLNRWKDTFELEGEVLR